MMGLSLSCSQQQSLDFGLKLKLSVPDEAVTIFPAVEEWLAEDDHMEALRWAARRKTDGQYRSVMDWLLCEVLPTERPACFRFYAGKGPRFEKLYGPAKQELYERVLLNVCMCAYARHQKKQWAHWRKLATEGLAIEFLQRLQ